MKGSFSKHQRANSRPRSSSPSTLLAESPRSATAISRSMNPLRSWSISTASIHGPPLGAEEAKEVREKIHFCLARLEGYAERGVWMAGLDLTAADIVAYPGL